jgi:hypothetical protein
MTQTEEDSCCELGVKGSCVTCEFIHCCNGKWSRGVGQGASVKATLQL